MNLRLGASSGGGEFSYKKLSEYGYQCADFQMAHTSGYWYTCTHSEFEKALKQEKAWADAYGIAIHQMHGPWDVLDNELENNLCAESLRNMLDKRKRSIEACSYLGCKNWVIHPIFPYGRDDEKIGKQTESLKINFEFYSELVETAREFDVTICFENMPFAFSSLNSVSKIKKFIDEINSDYFKACLDTGHVIAINDVSLGDAARIFGKDLKVLHVHDSRPGYDLHMMPFFGTADWEDFYKGLCDVEYGGVFNLECSPPHGVNNETREELERIQVRLAKQILHIN